MDAIRDRFADLLLIVAHGEKPEPKYAELWVSSTAMKQAPKNRKHWPDKFNYIFDPNDSKASKTVMLSTYDTFASRTIITTMEKRDKKKDRKRYVSKWNGVFNMVFLDEGHKLRHHGLRFMPRSKD
jgi:hypothetical protein